MKGILGKRVCQKYLFTELEIYLSPQWPWQFKMVAQFPAHLSSRLAYRLNWCGSSFKLYIVQLSNFFRLAIEEFNCSLRNLLWDFDSLLWGIFCSSGVVLVVVDNPFFIIDWAVCKHTGHTLSECLNFGRFIQIVSCHNFA